MRPLLAAALCFLLAWQPTAQASSAEDRAVQSLANVPALAKVASRGERATAQHLRKVGKIYARAGYRQTGAAIRDSGDALSLLAARGPDLRSARMVLRHLDRAMAKENLYLTPSTIGERLPNYRGIAIIFRENVRAALKNVRRGLPATHKLAGRKGTLWLTRTEDGSIVPTGNYGSSGSILIEGHWGGTAWTTIAIFPPDVELPPAASFLFQGSLAEPDVIRGIELPSGSRVVLVSAGFALPEGAVLWSDGGAFLPGLLVPQLVMPTTHFVGKPETRWVAYPPGTTLPANPLRLTLSLNVSYDANGIVLPPGSLIRERHESYVIPDGAIDLGGPGLEITRIDTL